MSNDIRGCWFGIGVVNKSDEFFVLMNFDKESISRLFVISFYRDSLKLKKHQDWWVFVEEGL